MVKSLQKDRQRKIPKGNSIFPVSSRDRSPSHFSDCRTLSGSGGPDANDATRLRTFSELKVLIEQRRHLWRDVSRRLDVRNVSCGLDVRDIRGGFRAFVKTGDTYRWWCWLKKKSNILSQITDRLQYWSNGKFSSTVRRGYPVTIKFCLKAILPTRGQGTWPVTQIMCCDK